MYTKHLFFIFDASCTSIIDEHAYLEKPGVQTCRRSSLVAQLWFAADRTGHHKEFNRMLKDRNERLLPQGYVGLYVLATIAPSLGRRTKISQARIRCMHDSSNTN